MFALMHCINNLQSYAPRKQGKYKFIIYKLINYKHNTSSFNGLILKDSFKRKFCPLKSPALSFFQEKFTANV